MSTQDDQDSPSRASPARALRADAQRSVDALLQAATYVFATLGVDAPVREIAREAGVGTGTLYRHFPERSDLIVAVFGEQLESCVESATLLSRTHSPGDALVTWLYRYAAFIATRPGLAPALLPDLSPGSENLRDDFHRRLRPALHTLMMAAAEAGEMRADVETDEILGAVEGLCMSASALPLAHTQRLVSLLVEGLRHRP